MKRLKISKTEALAVLLLRTQRLARMRNSLLLAALVLALTCAASPVLAGFDEGVTAYKAGDFTLAREEFLKTAEQGDAGAQYYLGLMYYNGQGVAQNYQAAGWWWRRAAEQGGVAAQHYLGVMYYNGEGVVRDYAAAAQWNRQAAVQGFALAQYNLGVMYYNGQGVARNYVEAYMWLSLAAAQSHEKAAKALDLLEGIMTSAQITAAQERARNWRPRSGGENDK